MIKEYIEKPKRPVRCKAIQVIEENKELIKTLSENVFKGFIYHDKRRWSVSEEKRNEQFNQLGCDLFIHDAYCRVFNGDYIIIMPTHITARTKESFEESFKEIVKKER